MMKRAEKNLILVAFLSILGFGYQNCAQSVGQTATLASVAPASIPALGDKVTPQKMATFARKLKDADSSKPYSIQEIVMSGSTVKEYVTQDGVIFAVTWRGLSNPDLSQLLGTYYSDYRAEKARVPRKKGMRFENTETSQVVVRRAGHMRDLQGQAYDARLFPVGFTVEDLQ